MATRCSGVKLLVTQDVVLLTVLNRICETRAISAVAKPLRSHILGIIGFLLILSRLMDISVRMNSFVDMAVKMRESDWKRYMEWVLSESESESEGEVVTQAGNERNKMKCKQAGSRDLISSMIPDVFR